MFATRVQQVVSSLPAGEVATYGEVAAWAGYPGAARAVGTVLAHSDGLPWWRVVTATGRLTPGHERTQARRLAAEGLAVRGNRVAGFVPPRQRAWSAVRHHEGTPASARALEHARRNLVRRQP